MKIILNPKHTVLRNYEKYMRKTLYIALFLIMLFSVRAFVVYGEFNEPPYNSGEYEPLDVIFDFTWVENVMDDELLPNDEDENKIINEEELNDDQYTENPDGSYENGGDNDAFDDEEDETEEDEIEEDEIEEDEIEEDETEKDETEKDETEEDETEEDEIEEDEIEIDNELDFDLMILEFQVWNNNLPPAVLDGDIINVSGSPSGTLNIPENASVTVEGAVIGATAGITLNIGLGATVYWRAVFTGASSGYLITLTGGGTIEIYSEIVNTGKSGGIRVDGAGTNIIIGGGGIVASDTGGYSLFIAANNAAVSIESGGRVESMSGNSNAAVHINDNITGANITINGGMVVSYTSGYAIGDGTGTNPLANNTIITVNDGAVTSGNTSAIRSSGRDSVVLIKGGTVSGAASNNLNPVIYMIGGTGTNIIIDGGVVQTLTNGAYALQTTGNIEVNGGLVSSTGGRAINLIGLNSTATINGGTVSSAAGNTICTATTNAETVLNSSVIINGGTVSSGTGNAIHITGDHSAVIINGGEIATASGSAVNSVGANASVTINGGHVSAGAKGNAINVTGVNTAVTINGGHVAAATGLAVNAVNSSVPVIIAGGFVFAYGTADSSVVSANKTYGFLLDGGVLAAWNNLKGITEYEEGTRDDLYINPAAGISNCFWDEHPVLGGGISYTNGINTGFFPLNNVTVKNKTPVTADVVISMIITGASANMKKEFKFTVCFMDSDGNPLSGNFEYEGGALINTGTAAPTDGILKPNGQGEAEFILAHGQMITIKNIPADGIIWIKEEIYYNYTTSFKDSEKKDFEYGNYTEKRTVGVNGRTFDFVNDHIMIVPTGIGDKAMNENIILLISMLVLLTGFASIEYIKKKGRHIFQSGK